MSKAKAEPINIDCGTFGTPEEEVTQAEPVFIDCGTIDGPEPEKEIRRLTQRPQEHGDTAPGRTNTDA